MQDRGAVAMAICIATLQLNDQAGTMLISSTCIYIYVLAMLINQIIKLIS